MISRLWALIQAEILYLQACREAISVESVGNSIRFSLTTDGESKPQLDEIWEADSRSYPLNRMIMGRTPFARVQDNEKKKRP